MGRQATFDGEIGDKEMGRRGDGGHREKEIRRRRDKGMKKSKDFVTGKN